VAMLKAYATKQDENFLADIQEIGRELATEGVPTEEIAEMHEEALRRLAEESPSMISPETISLVSPPLMEMLMAYGLAYREYIVLQESAENKFRQIFEQSNDGIVILNPKGNIVDVNLKAQEMWGYAHAEFLELTIPDLHSLQAREKNNNLLTNYFELLNTHTDTTGLTFETEFQRKDESVFYGEVSGGGMNLDGKALALGVIRDITQRKKAEAEREALNKQLIDTSRRVGMADVATGILHNVGNVLNSVNVAARIVADTVRRSSVDKISLTAGMIQEHLHDVGNYLTQDPKGQHIPEYLNTLGQQLIQDQEAVIEELKGLEKNIEHIKAIISVQQTVAKSSSMEEPVVLADLMDQALTVNQTSLDKFQVEVVKDFMTIPEIKADKHQVLQVLVNLINNAKHAMIEVSDRPRLLTLRLRWMEEKNEHWVQLEVSDTGVGISPENLKRVFAQGFTTKKDGHGFGLHSGALSAKMIGGSLSVHSDGEHQGATFTLTLPAIRREVGVA